MSTFISRSFFIRFIKLMESMITFIIRKPISICVKADILNKIEQLHDWIFHLCSCSHFLSVFLINISNTLRFKLINTWWIFTYIHKLNLWRKFDWRWTFHLPGHFCTRRYTLFTVFHMRVCVEHMRIDVYVVSAAAARRDDIKWVAPIFNGILLLFL